MERQLTLDLETAEDRADAMRKYLAPLKMAKRQVGVLCLLAGWGEAGERQGQAFLSLAITVAKACKKTGCGVGTFRKGVEDLERMRLVATAKNQEPFSYCVNLSRLAKLEPQEGCDPVDELADLFSDVQGARDSVKQEVTKVRDRDNVTPVARDTVGLNEAERLRRPWHQAEGVDDEMLKRAVLGGQSHILGKLYREAAFVLGWIQDGRSTESQHRFLAICHHAATCQGIHRRMGVVQARVKRELDVTKIRHGSEEWARKLLADRQPDTSTIRIDSQDPVQAAELFEQAIAEPPACGISGFEQTVSEELREHPVWSKLCPK